MNKNKNKKQIGICYNCKYATNDLSLNDKRREVRVVLLSQICHGFHRTRKLQDSLYYWIEGILDMEAEKSWGAEKVIRQQNKILELTARLMF